MRACMSSISCLEVEHALDAGEVEARARRSSPGCAAAARRPPGSTGACPWASAWARSARAPRTCAASAGACCASSAATEIMNTPRSVSTSTRRDRPPWCSPPMHGHRRRAFPPVAPRAAPAPAPLPNRLARGRRAERLGELLDGLLLLVGELLRDVDHEAVVDVARAWRAAAELRRALAAQALDGAVRGARGARAASWCRRASAPAPRRRAAPRGCVSGTSTSRLSPLRLKTGEGETWVIR